MTTYCFGSRWKTAARCSVPTGPRSTSLFEWQIRVVGRKITGSPNSSERAKASRIMSCTSWTDEGSRQGSRAKCAYRRVSCSFWELCAKGSSAERTTNPPVTPVYALVIKGSAATFSPTCFMVQSARCPHQAAASAFSKATFSFVDHSTVKGRSSCTRRTSITSEDGVPG